jgi:hypothetical protein
MRLGENPVRRERAFWGFLCGGLFLVYIAVSLLIGYRSGTHLEKYAGVIQRTQFVHVPRHSDGKNSEHFDLHVRLGGIPTPLLFRSFDRTETRRIEVALQVGKYAMLDVYKKNGQIWGVTSGGIMYLSPTHTTSGKIKDSYLFLSLGVAALIGSIIIKALPKNRDPHAHFD